MKFYNPLKAHAVKFRDGSYGIRRWVGWWWYRSKNHWYMLDTEENRLYTRMTEHSAGIAWDNMKRDKGTRI